MILTAQQIRRGAQYKCFIFPGSLLRRR